jgi:hypothetical protein
VKYDDFLANLPSLLAVARISPGEALRRANSVAVEARGDVSGSRISLQQGMRVYSALNEVYKVLGVRPQVFRQLVAVTKMRGIMQRKTPARR